MASWQTFSAAAPAIAATGTRLLARNEVAFLATASHLGRPRIHPFVPKVVQGQLVAFIMDSSAKIHDLRDNAHYALHALPGAEDEEFFISGDAREIGLDDPLRQTAASAMGFATGIDEHHVLFELLVERALWTRWLDFGTPDHRPQRVAWKLEDGSTT